MNKKNNNIELLNWLNEALEEITRKGQSVTPAAVNVPSASAPKNPKLIGKPTCTSAFYGKPDDNGQEPLTVRVSGIHAAHQNDLIAEWRKKYGQIFDVKVNQSQKVGNAAAPMEFYVAPGQEDAFVAIVPDLVQDIADMNGNKGMSYDQNFLNGLQLSILGRIDEAPTQEDLEKAQERQRMNLKDILSKLSDPEFLKKLGFVGGVSVNSYSNLKDIVKQGNSVGWRISPLNQLMVHSYLPNATFVTNAWTWDHVFNREVIDPSQFALEVKVSNDKPKDINDRMQAAAQLGYIDTQNTSRQPWDVYKSLSSQLSQSQRIAVEFLANILNPQSANYTKQKVYDISNTRLKTDANGNPLPDIWNDEVNFADNIRGIPNAAAQAYLAQSAANPDQAAATQAAAQAAAQQWAPRGNEEIADIINILAAICLKHCGTAPNTVAGDSLGDTIAHFAEFYAKNYVCQNKGIVKPSIVTATCNAFAISLAAIYGFQVQRRGAQLSGALKDPEFEKLINSLFMDFMDLVSEINVELLKLSHQRKKASAKTKTQVAENVEEMKQNRTISFQEFANIFVNGGNVNEEEICEEEVVDEVSDDVLQESFFRMLDKMEHLNG